MHHLASYDCLFPLFHGGKKIAAPYNKNGRDKQTSFISNPRYLPVHDALSDVTTGTTSPRFSLARVRIFRNCNAVSWISTRAAAVLVSEAPLSAASAPNFGG